jgi:sigma-B regulation protein RsbU (phosphoserine phosphatase)
VPEPPAAAATRLGDLGRALAEAFRGPSEETLPSRLCAAVRSATGARRASLLLREDNGWRSAGDVGEQAGTRFDPPVPHPARVSRLDGALWVPLESEGELHGMLVLFDFAEEEGEVETAAFLGMVFGSVLAAGKLSRLVKDAEFELKARLLELESLYDLGLSLGGQLDLASLADEVLFRSISLTDARKGALVLFGEDGRALLSRSVGGELLPASLAASWNIPEGEALLNNQARTVPTAGCMPDCEKCLAVTIAVPGRRLGILAVADKESRDGGVLDFTSGDARLLALFAAQAAGAIETARLHREAIEKERIERELELAAAIQREILPHTLPSVAGVELAAANIPARHIGGDYYDFFPLSRGRLGFLVADVSGKGVPAALLVSTVHAAVHLQIDESPTLEDLIGRIDRHLQRYAATRKFLTVFFGLVEPDSGTLRYVSAGHNPALLVRTSGAAERLESTGVPIGMLPNSRWQERAVTMEPGDLLCVYTDGVTEALDTREEEYGLDRLKELVIGDHAEPVGALCDKVLASVTDFARGMPQYDDQTLLLLRRSS